VSAAAELLQASATAGAATEAPSRAERITAAARQLFLTRGYGEASMDAVARAAGVSKATVYAHFASKEELFSAIIAAECRLHARLLASPSITQLGVEQALTQVGREYLTLVLSPVALCVYRTVIGESRRFPDLGRIFYSSGPAEVERLVAEYLDGAGRRGLLAIDDPALAADLFLSMVRGQTHLRCVLSERPAPADAELERMVAAAVSRFIRAYQP